MKVNEKWLQKLKAYMYQFVEFSEEEWQELSGLFVPLKVSKKEHFVTPGEDTVKLGFIIKGVIRTYFLGENGNEYTTDFCMENEFAAQYNCDEAKNEGYYSQAIVDSIILAVKLEDLIELGKKNKKLDILKSKIIDHYFPLKVEREKNLLSLDATNRYLHFLEKYHKMINLIPQYQVASYLGITPIALSRVKKSLKKT